MTYKHYSDAERSEAVIRLAVNGYDYKTTAAEMGVSIPTLRRWNKDIPKKGVAELLERAVERLLMKIPPDLGGQQWAVALGILLDKWLIVQGQPTTRSESVTRRVMGLTDAEYYDVLDEAEKLLDEIAGGGAADSGAAESG